MRPVAVDPFLTYAFGCFLQSAHSFGKLVQFTSSHAKGAVVTALDIGGVEQTKETTVSVLSCLTKKTEEHRIQVGNSPFKSPEIVRPGLVTGEDRHYPRIEELGSLMQLKRCPAIPASIYKEFICEKAVRSASLPPSQGMPCRDLSLDGIDGSTPRQSEIFSPMKDDALSLDVAIEGAPQAKPMVDLGTRLREEAQLDTVAGLGIGMKAMRDGLEEIEAADELALIEDDQQLVIGCVDTVTMQYVRWAAVQSAVRVRAKEHDHLGACQIGGTPQLAAQSNYLS